MHIYHEFTVSRISASPKSTGLRGKKSHPSLTLEGKRTCKMPNEDCGLQNVVELAYFYIQFTDLRS